MNQPVARLSDAGRFVEIDWTDGIRTRHFAPWLREHVAPADERDPRSGQRYRDVRALDLDIAVVAAVAMDGLLRFDYSDGATGVIDADTFRALSPAHGDFRSEAEKTAWRRGADVDHVPRVAWRDYGQDAAARLACLENLQRLGFFLLRGVPVAPGAVRDVITTFGWVRETNYGECFDVRVDDNPHNLAYTSRGLGAHTDNPYRIPAPTIQALHCLVNDVEGGATLIGDGFAAAQRLRQEDAAGFELLCTTPVLFRYADDAVDLRCRVPMVVCDAEHRITAIHYNDRSLHRIDVDAGDAPIFYRAYRRLAELLNEPDSMRAIKLEPGDCLVFDNTRVVHSRTAFEGVGSRHLQGAYGDLDGAFSALRSLRGRYPARTCAAAGVLDADSIVDFIAAIFERRGAEDYLGEPVSMSEHMLQAAWHAEQEGADDALVAAALLHDIGHFAADMPAAVLGHGADNFHEDAGATLLERFFPSEVCEPVRRHVAAKRYLCAVDPDYLEALSTASRHTLAVQGGPMSAAEATAFERSCDIDAVTRVRRWDDLGKRPGAPSRTFDDYRELLRGLLVPAATDPATGAVAD